MTSFTQPLPGEKEAEHQVRRNEMISFMIHRHTWPRARAIDFLESLDHVGIAYVGVDMKECLARERTEYDPFPFT